MQLDALVRSGRDPGETYEEGWLDPPPRIAVATEGSEGGLVSDGGEVRRYAAAQLPGPVLDMYGAGDSFAAGLTYGLGAGRSLQETLELAARCAALALTRRGAYGGHSFHRVVCKCCVVEENGVQWRKVEGKGLSANDASGRIRAHGRREGAHHAPGQVPRAFRNGIVITRGMDKCLYAYTPAEWRKPSRTSSVT